VKQSRVDIEDALWLEDHILSIPVSQDFGTNDMEYVAACVAEWEKCDS
jgi:hypothetical protein